MEAHPPQPLAEFTAVVDRQSYNVYYNHTLRTPALIGWAAMILVLLITGAFYWYNRNSFLEQMLTVEGVLAVVLSLSLIFLPFERSRKYIEQKDHFDRQRHYAFYAHHFCFHSPEYHSVESCYHFYKKAVECSSVFYLVPLTGETLLLPKRCMSPEQVALLRELFARQFGENFKTKET